MDLIDLTVDAADAQPRPVQDCVVTSPQSCISAPTPQTRKRRTGWSSTHAARNPPKRSCSGESEERNPQDDAAATVLEQPQAHVKSDDKNSKFDSTLGNTDSAQLDRSSHAVRHERTDGAQPDQPVKLSFWIPPDIAPGPHWTHEPYRSPTGASVEVQCAIDIDSSEQLARRFLSCPVLGFDMEWKAWGAKGIKENISLIQVASEDLIGLFHIALHNGFTVNKLVCPSLRKIIEDPNILKCGVAILNADGFRLRKFLSLDPRGLIELSQLHRVVKWIKTDKTMVTKRLVKMTCLAEEHLGQPLWKGDVRTSNWTKPLTDEQITYAAADAYAGFRLFHALEAKRFELSEPIPPRPALAELGLPLIPREPEPDADEEAILNETLDGTADFTSVAGNPISHLPSVGSAFRVPPISLLTLDNPDIRRLFSGLRALRKRIALKLRQPEEDLVSQVVLFHLAEATPRSVEEMNEAERGWAGLVEKEWGTSLVEFIAKRCQSKYEQNDPTGEPDKVEKQNLRKSVEDTPQSPSTALSIRRSQCAESRITHTKLTTNILEEDEDLAKYFSDDYISSDTEFDENGLLHDDDFDDLNDSDEDKEEEESFTKLETSFLAEYVYDDSKSKTGKPRMRKF